MEGQSVYSRILQDTCYTLHHQLVSSYQLGTWLWCYSDTVYQLDKEYTLMNQKYSRNQLHIPNIVFVNELKYFHNQNHEYLAGTFICCFYIRII